MSVDAHREAEVLMAHADRLRSQGQESAALPVYRAAAEHEAVAFEHVPPERPRTRGILAVSGTSLYWKGRAWNEAILHAHYYLAQRDLPEFAREQLYDLLLDSQRQLRAESAGRTLANGFIAVALKGPSVDWGMAPVDTVSLKLDQLKNFIIRVGEWATDVPFRTSGPPAPTVVDQFTLVMTPPSIGSFRFELRLAPRQLQLPLGGTAPAVLADRVADASLGILQDVSARSPHHLQERVPDEQYREVFVKHVRGLLPDGKHLREVEVRSIGGGSDQAAVLLPKTRRAVEQHLLPFKRVDADRLLEGPRPVGVLRALHLDKGWIILVQDGREIRLKISPNKLFDDVVGPFVNRRVRVEGYTGTGRQRGFIVEDMMLDDEPAD